MSQINRVPFGLQDLLASKNFGDNPAQLGQQVNPTLEMFPFFAAERFTWRATGTVNVLSDALWFTDVIPEGELWLVDAITCKVDPVLTVVGQSVSIGVQVRDLPNMVPPSLRQTLGLVGVFTNNAIGGLAAFLSREFPRLIPLVGGCDITWHIQGDFSGSAEYNLNGGIRYYKLLV